MNPIASMKILIALLLTLLLGSAFAADEVTPKINLPFRNGDFEQANTVPSPWTPLAHHVEGAKVTYGMSTISHNGNQSAMIEVAPDSKIFWYGFDQRVCPVQYGEVYQFTCWIKTENVTNGAGAYVGIELMDPNKAYDRISANDSDRFTGTTDWSQSNTFVFVPKGVHTLKINLVLHGTGRAYFDDAQLKRVRSGGELPNAKVSLKLTSQTIPSKFMGFGVEDDPFLLTGSNLKHNINEEDLALRERRIKAINPALVRSFLYWSAFNPSKDMKTFVYDSEGMKSLYRILASYQAMGVPVVITDTHWMWSKDEFSYNEKNVERGVEVYLKMLEYLIKERGLTCIRYATITNEPNMFWEGAGGTRASYDKANALFHEKLMKSGIKDHLQLIGADSAMSEAWLRQTVQNTDKSFGAYSFHNYMRASQYALYREIVQGVVGTVRDYSQPIETRGDQKIYKPTLFLEYGHLPDDWNDGNLADTMRLYEAALWTANANMDIINQGAAGGTLWCLHSMYYGEGLMVPGLWEFKDKQWAIRAVYYTQGLFSQFARPGATPLRLEAGAESCEFNASALKDDKGLMSLFLVNLAKKPVQANLASLPEGKYRVYALTRERFEAVKAQPTGEQMDCLATGEISIGKTHGLTMQPESFVVLRQIP